METATGHGVDDLVQEVWLRLLAEDGRLLRRWDAERAGLPHYVNLIAGQTVAKVAQRGHAQKRRPEGGFADVDDAPEPAQPHADPERRAAERGTDVPEPIDLDADPWHERLKNIDEPMLRQTLTQAAREHVDNGGYLPLITGGRKMLVTVRSTASEVKSGKLSRSPRT